jgi:hypothetical protein
MVRSNDEHRRFSLPPSLIKASEARRQWWTMRRRVQGGREMKFTDVLRGYIFPNEDEIKEIWTKADFCLDTNVLLDVYRYRDKNRVAFLKPLGTLKGRLFVPNRVAVEFARNRITVIREHWRLRPHPHRENGSETT